MTGLTTVRYLVVLLLAAFLLWVVLWLGLFSIAVAIFTAGAVLFSSNRKWSDWISFVIFGFGVIASLAVIGRSCLIAESCWDSLGTRLTYVTEGTAEALFLLLSILSMSVVILCHFEPPNPKKLR